MNEIVFNLAKMIDHSILHPTMTDDDLRRECGVAKKYEVASVCVKPYAVKQAVDLLKGSNVLVLGAAYKPDIDDLRESPAIDVIRLLQQKGAIVSYHDPYVPSIKLDGWAMQSIKDLMTGIKTADCVVIVTNHKVYDYPAILQAAKLIVDTRNALGKLGAKNPKVVRL